MRVKGKLTSWHDTKGFGHITPHAGDKRVFIHIKALRNGSRRPELNQVVTYALSTDEQGRPCAADATLAGDRPQRKPKRKSGSRVAWIGGVFLAVVGVAVVLEKLPLLLLEAYLVISLLTFVMYAIDKSAARKGGWRTRENTLHGLAFAGGWPGALVAQHLLRHKTAKQPFRAVFWITVVLNCGIFVWLLSPTGTTVLAFLYHQLEALTFPWT